MVPCGARAPDVAAILATSPLVMHDRAMTEPRRFYGYDPARAEGEPAMLVELEERADGTYFLSALEDPLPAVRPEPFAEVVAQFEAWKAERVEVRPRDVVKLGPKVTVTEQLVEHGVGMLRAADACNTFVDDGRTRRCATCGWWRTTHAPDAR
jgi:hypothetical protein